MKTAPGRRFALMTMGLGMAADAAGLAALHDGAAIAAEPSLLPPFASTGHRVVVFLACHNAIWELAARLIATEVNPDGLSHGALAAELTNHLIGGVVLTSGVSGTLPELQRAGFNYANSG